MSRVYLASSIKWREKFGAIYKKHHKICVAYAPLLDNKGKYKMILSHVNDLGFDRKVSLKRNCIEHEEQYSRKNIGFNNKVGAREFPKIHFKLDWEFKFLKGEPWYMCNSL